MFYDVLYNVYTFVLMAMPYHINNHMMYNVHKNGVLPLLIMM